MADRTFEEIDEGIKSATPEEPFLLTRAELIAHLEGSNATGCGGYSTVVRTDGRRDVGWDYACKD